MATKNRLEELQNLTENEKKRGSTRKKKTKNDSQCDSTMEELEVTRKLLSTLESNTKRCEEVYRSEQKTKGLRNKLKEIFTSSEIVSMKIAKNLKKIENVLKDSENKQSAEFRMQFIQYHSVAQRFKEAVCEYQEWMERIHAVEKKFIKKCYQITNHEPLEDKELSQLIEENPQLFTEDYVKNEIEARRQLADIEERQNCLTLIEGQLIEIRTLFEQIAMLIEQQQENINRIDFLTGQVSENVDDSANALRNARSHKIRNRKIIFILCVIILVFVLILIASFTSSASNRIIHAKDHASIQLSLVEVNPTTGRMTDKIKTYALCGNIRRMGESDDCLVRLAKKDGILSKNY